LHPVALPWLVLFLHGVKENAHTALAAAAVFQQVGRTGPDGLDELAVEAEIIDCQPLPDG
jgi:hypothetical protein